MAGLSAAIGENLPVSWALSPLGEITRPERPKVRPGDYPQLPFIGMEHIEAHTMRLIGTVPAGTMKSQAVHFFPGDVLYGRLRPYLNKVFRPEFEGLCSAEFIVFPVSDDLNGKYLQYFLNSTGFVSFAAHLDEGDRPRVDFIQLSSYLVPIPPLPEQHRIVAEIEKQFTRRDAAVAALERVQLKLKQYHASVLKAACAGRLVPTEAELARAEGRSYESAEELRERIVRERRAEWEAGYLAKGAAKAAKDNKWKTRYQEPVTPDPTRLSKLPEGWAWATIDQLATVVRGASPRPAGDPKLFGGEIPWITVGAITADTSPYLRTVSEGVTEAGKAASRYIPAETLLLTNSGASLGVPKINLIAGCINDGSVALLSVPDPTKLYLYYFLSSQTRKLRAINQGAAQPNLNTTIVRSILVPLPPQPEQKRIIAEVDKRLSVSDEMQTLVEANLRRAGRLRQGILKRAFEGRLIPHDPNDESASLPLERIRAARIAATRLKAPVARRVKKATTAMKSAS